MPGTAAAVTEEEREALRSTARELLGRHSSPAIVRRRIDGGGGEPSAIWELMVELGWPGVAVPEALGGVGYGLAELVVLLQEVGRHLGATALGPTTIAGAGLLAARASPRRDALLQAITRDGCRVAVALETFTAASMVAGSTLELVGDLGRQTLRGSAGIAWAAAEADEIMVAARDGADLKLVAVAARNSGVAVEPQDAIDRTRSLALIRFDDVAVAPADVLSNADEPVLARLVDVAAVAVAADSVGGAERAMELTVEHVKQRVQFGRAIGSFQAVKHACADMFVAVETSRSAVDVALRGLERSDVSAASAAASEAKALCADAYAAIAGEAIQLHGGIGFTWESDIQLHLKRAKLNQQLLGSSSWHRRRAATLLFDSPAAANVAGLP